MTKKEYIKKVKTLPPDAKHTITNLLEEAFLLINRAEVRLIHEGWRGLDSDLPIFGKRQLLSSKLQELSNIFSDGLPF